MADDKNIEGINRIILLRGTGTANVYPKALVDRKPKPKHKEQPPRKQDKSKKEGVDIQA